MEYAKKDFGTERERDAWDVKGFIFKRKGRVRFVMMKLRSTRFECPPSFVIHRLKVTMRSILRLAQAWPAIG